jgi:hypothetical protein
MVQEPPQPLSNIQVELLKLYATGISDGDLLEVKDLLANFLFQKAMKSADEEWDKRGYNNETLNQWLNK